MSPLLHPGPEDGQILRIRGALPPLESPVLVPDGISGHHNGQLELNGLFGALGEYLKLFRVNQMC